MATTSERLRFISWWSGIGGAAPLFLTLLSYSLKISWVPGERAGSLLWILTWVVWPSWVLMIDAEHTAQLVVMLMFSSILNGLWYGLLGFIFWQVFHREKNTGPKNTTVNE